MKRFLNYRQRNKILIEKKLDLRVCGRCRNEFPTTEFNKNPKRAGGYYSLCKKCIVKTNCRIKKIMVAGVKTLSQKKLYNGATDISILKDMPKFSSTGFSLREAKRLFAALQEWISWRGEKKQADLFKEYLPNHSYSRCIQVKTELVKAAQAGMTLEEYFLKNRPFRVGKKILAGGKKP